MIVKDKNGWITRVIDTFEDGVLVDWDFVEEKKMRFLKHGEYEIVEG